MAFTYEELAIGGAAPDRDVTQVLLGQLRPGERPRAAFFAAFEPDGVGGPLWPGTFVVTYDRLLFAKDRLIKRLTSVTKQYPTTDITGCRLVNPRSGQGLNILVDVEGQHLALNISLHESSAAHVACTAILNCADL